jgi:hypothetical protein
LEKVSAQHSCVIVEGATEPEGATEGLKAEQQVQTAQAPQPGCEKGDCADK